MLIVEMDCLGGGYLAKARPGSEKARRVADRTSATGGQARDGLSASLADVAIRPKSSSRSQCDPLSALFQLFLISFS